MILFPSKAHSEALGGPLTYLFGGSAQLLTARICDLSTTESWGERIPHCGGRSVHCRVFSSTSGLYSLDASNILPPDVTIEKVFGHFRIFPESKPVLVENCWVKNTALSRPTPNKTVSPRETAEAAGGAGKTQCGYSSEGICR